MLQRVGMLRIVGAERLLIEVLYVVSSPHVSTVCRLWYICDTILSLSQRACARQSRLW